MAANDFGAAITQQAFGAGVEQGNQAVGMGGDDADPGRRVEHCLQKAARFAGLFFMAHALQGGADPAGEQAHKLFIGLIKGRRARLAGREAQSAEALTGDPDAGADIAFQGKQRVTGVGGMFTLAHGSNGDYIIAAQGNAAIGVTEDEALTVLQGVGRRHLNPDLVGVRLDLADDADWHVIELCTQLQGLAQLFMAAQLRQCGNFIERAQGCLLTLHMLLGLHALMVAAQGFEQLAEGGQQRLQLYGELFVVATFAVRQTEHAAQLAIGMNRQAGKCQ